MALLGLEKAQLGFIYFSERCQSKKEFRKNAQVREEIQTGMMVHKNAKKN